ncbi:DUF2306 domain-containing protein [Streptomyces sp. NRRL B-1677]|uniref:DUF2306 domain-containing protein n=1 Tax=Streptomyces sp. NRRL B-1677 TaxID=2682966 RepID=UPI001892957D|nr:DUF2306 domain-containing protein [Streptomyces sp. NRRL B-1677]MBF6049146.1 DUF2306 domain-containing protein [Streptomyces sp. NRRL B-1677]
MSQNTRQTGRQMPPPEGLDTDQRPAVGAERPWWKKYYPWYAVVGGTVLFNLLYSFPRYFTTDSQASRSPLDTDFHPHFAFLIAHVVTGNLALVTMMLQAWPHLRRTRPEVHRWSGRVYVFGAVIPTTLIVLFVLVPHRPNQGSTGLACSAVLWLGTTLYAWRKARLHRYAEHRRWMIYSFSLALFTTYGRVVAEMILNWGLRVNTEVLVEGTSWGAWIINLLIAQAYLEYTARRRSKDLPAGRFDPATGAIRQ